MEFEIGNDGVYCHRCGTKYPQRKRYFPVNYGILYKGVGYLPYCKECIDAMYNGYLEVCREPEVAARQVCRKLDLYWNKSLFEQATRKSTPRTLMSMYLSRLSAATYTGRSYDDTLAEEGSLWSFPGTTIQDIYIPVSEAGEDTEEDARKISDEVIAFWGNGYSPSMYMELEQRKKYYLTKIKDRGELDVGTEILVRQICNLEVSIARDSAAGKSIDKSVNSLNNLLGSLNLKPTQRRDEDIDAELASTPMGVWIYRYENKRPLPEIDDQLKDVNHIKKYIFTWMGHLCKMLNIKNGYTRLYEEEIRRLHVEKPEYDGDDDEALMIRAYSEKE